MLGAEKPTRQHKRTQPGARERTTNGENAGAKASGGRLVARSGIDAVNSTEARICGTGAVHSPSIAEGMALAGSRAATLLTPGGSPETHIAGSAPWVHHRLASGRGGAAPGAAFELVAATAQEAVDHCLVAHRLALRLGRPGLCTLDATLAHGLHLVRLPDEATLSDLAAGLGPDLPAEGAPRGEQILRLADEVLDRVSELTGRRLSAVTTHGQDDSSCVLVASGASAGEARRLADRLAGGGHACRVLTVSLVRPFPADALVRELKQSTRLIVLESRAEPVGHGLAASVRKALGGEEVEVERVAVDGKTAGDLCGEISAAFGWPAEAPDSGTPSNDVESRCFAMGIRPASGWSDELLLETAAHLGAIGEWTLSRPRAASEGVSVLELAPAPVDGVETNELDLLFAAHPTALDPERAISAVRYGGVVVVDARADSAESLWFSLNPAQREQLLQRRLTLGWIDSAAVAARDGATPERTRTWLQGALLAANGSLSRVAGCTEPVLEALAGSGAETPEQMAVLVEGANALQVFDPSTLQGQPAPHQQDFKGPTGRPRMPATGNGEPDPSWNDAVLQFHRTHRGAFSEAEPLPALPLIPAALSSIARAGRARRDFPWVIETGGDGASEATGSLASLIARALDEMQQAGEQAPLLRTHSDHLVRTAARILRGRTEDAPLGTLLDAALETFAAELDVSDAGAGAVRDELAVLKARMPRTGSVIALGRHTLLNLCTATMRRERHKRIGAFRKDVETLVRRLNELLQLDDAHSESGTSPERLASALPDLEHLPLDPAALSRNLPRHRGSKRMPASRRSRIEQAIAVLRGFLGEVDGAPEMIILHSGIEIPVPVNGRLRVVRHADGMEAAIGLFDGLAERTAEVVRAARLARLETRGEYDVEHHGPILERFDREALNAEELMLVPPVLVVESGERLKGGTLASFSELLRSGRPVHVVVVDQASGIGVGEAWESLSGYHPGLGYVAVAHREALVVQSTLGDPGHLAEGLRRMATATVPSAAFVAVPSWDATVPPWVQLAAARHGRATPCFVYDADAGATWAERFDLSGNPQPENAWPVHRVEYVGEEGAEGALDEAFTFAHAVAADPAYRKQFRVIPARAWSDDQIELAAWLEAGEAERRLKAPFVWVDRDDGSLGRAVVTRELAFACRDRRRAWRILQELAGTDNEYAHRAAEAARQQTLLEAERARDELEAAHVDELARVRADAGAEAVDRIVAVLLNLDSAPTAGAAVVQVPAAEAPVVEAPAEEAEVEGEEEEEEEEELGFDEPYITSVLCTTCQECININPRLFRYNDNKQAVIADVAAGTFEQLVKAAEKCPARCIHPGVPRDDDSTASDNMIQRAQRFR